MRAVPVRGALTLFGYLALFLVLNDRAWDGVRATEQMATAAPDLTTWIELVADPVPEEFRTRAIVRVDGRQLLGVAGRPASSALNVLAAGDRILVTGRVVPLPPSDATRWHRRHVGGQLSIEDVLSVRGPSSVLTRAANRIRSAVLTGAGVLPSPESGVVAGLLVGDTRGIPDDVIDDFRAAGLSHLLAVSGANVAFVLALVGPLIRRFRLKGRFATSLTVILLFAAATRFEPSVLRASAMAALAAAAAYVGRPASGLRVLGLAIAGLLLIDPFLMASVGFRLSCAACAGIVLWARPIAERLPGPVPVREALAVTLAAQVAVTPVLLPLFGGVPVATLPANALAAPLTGPLTMWGMTSGLVAAATGPFVPELNALLQLPTIAFTRALLAVAHLCAAIPWTIGPAAAWGLFAATAAVAAVRTVSRMVDPDGARPFVPDPAAGSSRP